MLKKEEKLITNLFINSLGAFFLSMLTSSLGSLVDGLIIGNTMNTQCVAAFGLINPLNYTFALIGSILSSGLSNSCARALGENKPDKANALLSVTNAAGIGLSVIVTAFILLFADKITVFLGAGKGTETFMNARQYLIFYVFGLPAITGTKLLSSVMQLDSDRIRIVVSTFVMTTVNILGDLLCVYVFHSGLAGIAFITTISYYAGWLVLLLHFCKKNIMFRFVFGNPDWKSLFGIMFRGLPKGISRISSTVRGIYINRIAAGIATTAVAAYAVQENVNFLVNAVIMGIAQTFMILVSMYYGEGNKSALRRVVHVACLFELLFTGLLSVIMFICAPFVAKLYLGSNMEALDAGILCLRWFAVSLLSQGYCILFADYLQVTGKVTQSNLVYIVENILFTVTAVAVLTRRFRMPGLFAGIAAAHILTLLSVAAYVMLWNKSRNRNLLDLLMLKDGFGVLPENEYAATITELEGAVAASGDLVRFCRDKGIPSGTAGHLGLAAEEMVVNILEHGFTDGKPHYIDLRAIYYPGESMTLIIRDNCRAFDPVERFRYLSNDDPTANFGLRLVMGTAKDISYTSTLKLNNLTIKM